MPSTPLMACSSGVVTAVSTSCAFAPVEIAVAAICGGASTGYCATGIDGIATTPARMMTSEHTDARIGRRMNVLTNMLFRLDGCALGNLLDAGHDQLVPRLQPGFHDVVVPFDLADL